MEWEKTTKDKFEQILAKMPVFMRPIAQKAITEKTEGNAKNANRAQVEERDLIDALFSETPFGFHGMMKNDLNSMGIDYMKYGYEK
jgi:hypothetical protein